MAVSLKRKQPPTDASSSPHTPTKHQKTLPYTANTSVKRSTPSTSGTPIPSPRGTHTPVSKTATTTTTLMAPQLALISSSSTLTPYQKRVLSLLCQVPRGSVTTYGLMAAHLGSSPRAIGNAMRRNPFAPAVPCHRVVATGGALGGFKGVWTKNGEGITLDEKKVLLKDEGVRFDAAGRVVGTPFCGFV